MIPRTIYELIVQGLEQHPKTNALMYKRGRSYRAISSSDFLRMTREFAAGLVQLGVQKGDRIALLSENRPEWAIADLAILALGAINVPVYNTLPPAQVAVQLGDSGSRIVIASSRLHVAKIFDAATQIASLPKIVCMDDVGENDPRILSFEEVLNSGKKALLETPESIEVCHQQVRSNDIASIIYTSGTTGVPKGVMLSHENIVANVLGCSQVLRIDTGDVVLSFLPLCHIFERTVDYFMMSRGATIAYAENIESVPQNMRETRPTVVAGVPRLFEKMHARIMETIRTSPAAKRKLMTWALAVGKEWSQRSLTHSAIPAGVRLKHAIASRLVFSKLREKLGGRLRYFISGGAPLDKELAEFFFGVGITILEGYGLTETSPVIAVNHDNHFKFGTVGKPLPNVEVKMAADGEILVRGPSVMVGYYQKERETQEALEGGWFHTGDIGELDGDGFLRITDRKKDLIVTASGKNVPPQKLELLLGTNPYIASTVVVGDRRPFISALIVPNQVQVEEYARERGLHFESYADLVQVPEVYSFLMEQIDQATADLAPFERIKKIVLLEKDFSIESGELTPTMKIRRRVVEAKHKDLIDNLYAKSYQAV